MIWNKGLWNKCLHKRGDKMSVQVTRIATKFNEIFSDKIDMSDIEATSDKYANAFQSRCLAAYALVMEAGIDFDIAAASVTDGFHDWGIDSIFKDENSKKLYVVQAKWVNDGNGTIAQGDTLKFTNGIEKILNLDFSDFNDKILAKKNEIESAVRAMDYQIKLVVIYTSNNPCSTESTDAINKLMNRINDDCNELLLEKVLHLTEIYDCCICQPKIRSKGHLILGHFLDNKYASENCTKAQYFKRLVYQNS